MLASAKNEKSPSVAKAFSAGSVPLLLYASVSLRVSILLASTSGWLNALMPMIEPATAVANSQRKNSCAICIFDASEMVTTGWPASSSVLIAASCAASGLSVRRR